MSDSDDEAPRAFSRGAAYAYAQVAGDIAARIRSGEWPHDARLPSRDELAAEYGVAERTVRRAMQVLEAEGMVAVVPAKGVYVTWPVHGTRTP
jgi:DNA-binding GntR family transcriptional regulator